MIVCNNIRYNAGTANIVSTFTCAPVAIISRILTTQYVIQRIDKHPRTTTLRSEWLMCVIIGISRCDGNNIRFCSAFSVRRELDNEELRFDNFEEVPQGGFSCAFWVSGQTVETSFDGMVNVCNATLLCIKNEERAGLLELSFDTCAEILKLLIAIKKPDHKFQDHTSHRPNVI